MAPTLSPEITVACVPNIGPTGIRRRRDKGVVVFVVAVALSAGLTVLGAGPPWQWMLVPVFGYAAVCWFQAREKT